MKEVKQSIIVRKDLNMRKGKIAAQAAHAAMAFLLDKLSLDGSIDDNLSANEYDWIGSGTTKIVLGVNSEKELMDLVKLGKDAGIRVNVIKDAGKTEFNGIPTITCAAFGPDDKDKIDKILGHLELI